MTIGDIWRDDMRVIWTGGAYPEREGIAVLADPEGLTVWAWYDGGILLENEGRVTWDELDTLRPR